ncbi:methyl-accepting chemotaxis protein [Neorhizobium sp. P12A]|uniref:HAMP domain-containing methyl-accepting chemotaxis protein n=1 Tax=Neorhizobium sp. P12A TaxID=2268027 RepID=UPI0011EF0FBC|nr:methyl-accepting chemotaxis protein [Neorhizobium sp. P12A]KAA0698048.1 methyl-accepting chemotaxis protein [Neorhizobium sp. P12A]
MKRPNIKSALIAIFSVFAILFGAIAYFSLTALTTLAGNTEEFATDYQPSISKAKDIQIARYSLRGSYLDIIPASSPEDTAVFIKKITDKEAALRQSADDYKKLVNSPDEQKAFDGVVKSIDAYTAEGQKIVSMAKAGKRDEATIEFKTNLGPIADALAKDIDNITKLNQDGADAALVESRAQYDNAILLLWSILGVSALLICGASIFGITGIANPIGRMTKAMLNLASGDTASTIAGADRADEIGGMARAVEVFRQAAISNKRLEAEAEANRIEAENERIRVTAEAEASAQARLTEATAGLASGLRLLAAGDLSFELSEPFAPDFETLRHDLNNAVSQLDATLGAVANAAATIGSGTREIGQGADDLSKRTEHQAASLEETAAALDQITVNVSNSSQRAEEARQIALQANHSAAQSGAVVAAAVEAMHKIEQSSNQISNIIGVIDEIAFQTNLLALNAGVEAARAGEAGKGFAVVAQEVRELAQRSAQAAKEIKDLIGKSSVEVQGGVKLVRDTGDALRAIESLIVTINQHMDAIATSSREQSTGLSEVNTAVNQMDQVTQQNAAMVEETNAASATLAAEAAHLKDLIDRFKMKPSSSMSTGRSRSGNVAQDTRGRREAYSGNYNHIGNAA